MPLFKNIVISGVNRLYRGLRRPYWPVPQPPPCHLVSKPLADQPSDCPTRLPVRSKTSTRTIDPVSPTVSCATARARRAISSASGSPAFPDSDRASAAVLAFSIPVLTAWSAPSFAATPASQPRSTWLRPE